MLARKHGDRGDSRDFHPNWLFDPADFSLENQLLAMNTVNFPLIKLASRGTTTTVSGLLCVPCVYKGFFDDS